MSIIKIKKRETPFVQIDKTALQDTRLSWKAKGILAYLLSLPQDWQLYIKELQEHATDGRDSTSKGINELIKIGYITREKKRDDKGHFKGYQYNVFEQPQTETPQTGNPFTENPKTDKPKTGEPITENPQLLIINNTNKENNNKNNTNKEDNGDKSPATNPKKEVETKKQDKPLAEPSKAQRLNEQLIKQFKEVMEHLIAKTGRAFKIAKTDALIKRSDKFKKIAARLREGYIVSDLKAVIDTKCKEWLESPKMSQFLQPSTLFCARNFEKYLDQAQNTNLTNYETTKQKSRSHRNGARTTEKFRNGVDGFLRAYSEAISVEDIDHDELAASWNTKKVAHPRLAWKVWTNQSIDHLPQLGKDLGLANIPSQKLWASFWWVHAKLGNAGQIPKRGVNNWYLVQTDWRHLRLF